MYEREKTNELIDFRSKVNNNDLHITISIYLIASYRE